MTVWKKFAVFVFVLMATIVFVPTATALAAPELKVSVSAGLDGKVKYGKGAPVTITVENSGTAFSGDLVIDIPYSYSMGAGEAIPLDIGAGETKTVSFTIQRMDDNGRYGVSNLKTIFLYEGGWKKGKEIEHKGAQQITTSMFYEDSRFTVLFTENVDRLASIKVARFSNSTNNQVMNASQIADHVFPEEADGWGTINFMIVDEYPLADLSAKQQEALVGWVRSGGILVMGGSDNSRAEAGVFADHLPLQLTGSTETNATILNKWVGTEGFEGMIPSYRAELTADAQPLFEDGDNVLAAYKRLGEGIILQTAFSIGDEPIAKMAGMSAFWTKMLETGERTIPANQMSRHYYDDPMDMLVYTIGSANELFPSFKVSAPLIFGIIIFYVILIIPVLYFILKRKDKREYTWWIIPAIAVVTSIAIFAYGAKDRMGRAQIQHSAVLNVEQDGSLAGYYAESLLTNKSGDFTFTAPTGTSLLASMQMNGNLFGYSTGASAHKRTMMEKSATATTAHLRNVGYWDVASLYGKTRVEKMGNYSIKLTVDDKQLTGTVTNDFPFALTDVAIWSGTKLIPIGDLGPGETAQVNETLKTSTLLPRRSMYNNNMNPQPTDPNDLAKMRQDSLLTFSGEPMNKTSKPVIIGYTDTQLIPIELEQVKPSVSSMTMIVQEAEVNVTFTNTFTIVPEMMTMSLLSEENGYEADFTGYPIDEYYFNEPVYLQTWQLPEDLMDKKLQWTSIDVSKIKTKLYEASILNIRTGLFEQQDSSKFTITKNVDDYVTPEGKIVMRLVIIPDVQNGNQGRAPVLKLNGEVAK